jgi:hypothetical protein
MGRVGGRGGGVAGGWWLETGEGEVFLNLTLCWEIAGRSPVPPQALPGSVILKKGLSSCNLIPFPTRKPYEMYH